MKIVITGAAHARKTTLVEALHKRGYRTFPESTTAIAHESVTALGQEEHKNYLKRDYPGFMVRVAQRQWEHEKHPPSGIMIYDRSLLDCIAFCRLRKVPVPALILVHAKSVKYDVIMNCSLSIDFQARAGTGRTLTREQADAMGEISRAVYEEQGYPVEDFSSIGLQDRLTQVTSFIDKR